MRIKDFILKTIPISFANLCFKHYHTSKTHTQLCITFIANEITKFSEVKHAKVRPR